MSAILHPGKAKVIPGPSKLLPYQTKWVEDESRLKIAEKSRQIGWTWTAAFRIVRVLSVAAALYDFWISSRDEIQARLFLEDCKGFANVYAEGARALGEQVIDDRKNTAYVLGFANGKRANSMSSNPDAQAGKRGARVLDEFALHPDPRKLYSIAYPGITWGGGLEIFSTHRGTANYFNQLLIEAREKGNPKRLSVHRVTLQDALDQGFLFKLQAKLPEGDERLDMDEAAYFDFIRNGCSDEESFRQEYMCVPSDDASAFLSYEEIDGCKYRPGELWETDLSRANGALHVGVDVARTKDLTSIIVTEKLGDVKYVRRMIDLKNMPFSAQEEILYPLLELPQVRRCCIDATGLGRQFAERAAQRFGSFKVEGITFTGAVKEELAFPLKAAFQDRHIRIPDSDVLVADLRNIRKETTASNHIRFAGERTADGHSDRFWAMALAVHAAKTASGPFVYETVDVRGRSGRTMPRGRVLA